MISLVGSIIKNKYDSMGQYGEIIRIEPKRGFSNLYELEYKYLDERIRCTMQYNVARYDGKIYTMSLIGGKGGHWVTNWELEIVEAAPVIQQTLF